MLAAPNNFPEILKTVLAFAALSVAFNVTVWAVALKYGLQERYEAKKPVKWPNLCFLCITFWVTVAYTLPIAAVSGHWELLLAPFCAAGITIKQAFK